MSEYTDQSLKEIVARTHKLEAALRKAVEQRNRYRLNYWAVTWSITDEQCAEMRQQDDEELARILK